MLKLVLIISDFVPENSYKFFSYKKEGNARLSCHQDLRNSVYSSHSDINNDLNE